jgi:hypothetical protein
LRSWPPPGPPSGRRLASSIDLASSVILGV